MKYLLSLFLASFLVAPLPIPPLQIAPAIAPQVHAAAPNGCTQIGTVGNVIIAHCVDDQNGGEVWANSAGFMAVEP